MKDLDSDNLFNTGVGNKRLWSINKICANKGENMSSVLPAVHCFTGCNTTSAFERRRKMSPLKLVEKNPVYMYTFAMLGENHEYSNDMLVSIEQFVCHMYGHRAYRNINKLRFDIY